MKVNTITESPFQLGHQKPTSLSPVGCVGEAILSNPAMNCERALNPMRPPGFGVSRLMTKDSRISGKTPKLDYS